MRFTAVLIWIIAALLIACSSESTSPPPQVRNETSTDARPSVAATATELPTAMPAAELTPDQSVPPSTMDPAEPPTTTEAPKAQPVTETAPTATPQEPTATAPPTATLTGTATVLRVTVSAVPATLPDYDRHDWKHWTDADGDCQNARNEVLIAESKTSVAYRTDRKCRVAAGEWLAPYTNTIVTDPGRLDVDHMVPLGNAHASGAWEWSAEQREQYANYLDDPQHLIAVTASANRSKGARGPEEWRPDDRSYWCQYAVDWITIKDTWELTATTAEFTALEEMLATCDVPHQLGVVFRMEKPDLPSLGGSTRSPLPLLSVALLTPRTIPATRPKQPGKAVCKEAKVRAKVSQSQWCPPPGMGTETAWCAKNSSLTTLVYTEGAPQKPAALVDKTTLASINHQLAPLGHH